MIRYDSGKYLSEFVCSFIFTFVSLMTVATQYSSPESLGKLILSLVFGVVSILLILAFGKISGAHFNPAVTLTFIFSKRMPVTELFPYLVSQIAGAISGALLARFYFPKISHLGMTIPSIESFKAFSLELILSFLFLLLAMRSTRSYKFNSLKSGLIVGLAIFSFNLFSFQLIGSSLNISRSLAACVANYNFDFLWIYLSAQTLSIVILLPLLKRINNS